ncbi:MAG: hypothetical protein IJ785_05390 [Bacteroidales bacterium]|nr:hypothetical protein [Bacteroidales bacterium]
MRRIHKGDCPNILATQAAAGLVQLENDLAQGIDLNFNSNIYNHADVKRSLKTSHRQKCAYCERYLNGDFGDIEHFRPKGGHVDATTGELREPGYWWLAYDWNNLLLSCSECNRSHKRNKFPLLDENQRNIANKDISQEEPLLINPAEEDPANHIEFNRWVALPKEIDGTEDPRGMTTIDILSLNGRRDLVEKRRRRWEEVAEARMHGIDVSSWTDDSREFTGMFQNQINNN